MEGKNILIVGASSGIGKELAADLISKGANVYAMSRTGTGPEGVISIKADITEEFDISGDLPNELHGLVYCPGTINLKPLQSLTEKDFVTDYQINLIGAFKVIKASLKSLRASGDASIILFSTVAASTGMGFHASIAAAKGAVEGFARSIAAELATKNIRVNVVAPSLTDTPLASQLLSTDEKREASAKRHPLGKIGTAKQIGALASFLLTPEASWITGQTIGIDGGLSKIKT